MAKLNGSRVCIEALEREGVETIFGIPGGAIMPFYDALLDSNIRHVLTRHEQGAAHMADGYARASGRVGVCLATSGPGATNLVTGIATAFMDSSPILAITGQVSSSLIGTEAFQEADVMSLAASVTKRSFQFKEPKEIPAIVRSAFHIAYSGRQGPVLIDFPKDVQTLEDEVVPFPSTKFPTHEPQEPPKEQIIQGIQALTDCCKPLILVGGGARMSNAGPEIVRAAETLGIPVATTFIGKGAMPENHPLSLGTIGMHGRPYSNLLISQADLILAVGCRFSDRSTSSKEFGKNTTIVHIDVDSSEAGKTGHTRIPIVGDAKRSMKALLSQLGENNQNRYANWLKQVDEVRRSYVPKQDNSSIVRPPKLLKELRQMLPVDAIVTTDVGQHQMWAGLFFDAYQARDFITSAGLGTMGFGFPAAMGAKIARPDKVVVNLTGDGSFVMNAQELACSVTENIPVIVIIINNKSLGMVAQWQRTFFNNRYSAIDMGNSPDFAKMAEAFGAVGVTISSYDEFSRAVKSALASDVTTVIDVPISPEEDVYPFVIPGKPLTETLLGDEFVRSSSSGHDK
ncbi:MAG: biosynthetic-type acetolactate synthase large subunit [Candidatus Bathyarchaeia archaeon]